jgi:heme exporter protein CcmD
MSELLHLGGYGFSVWGSYGVTFTLLAIELILLRKRARKQ